MIPFPDQAGHFTLLERKHGQSHVHANKPPMYYVEKKGDHVALTSYFFCTSSTSFNQFFVLDFALNNFYSLYLSDCNL